MIQYLNKIELLLANYPNLIGVAGVLVTFFAVVISFIGVGVAIWTSNKSRYSEVKAWAGLRSISSAEILYNKLNEEIVIGVTNEGPYNIFLEQYNSFLFSFPFISSYLFISPIGNFTNNIELYANTSKTFLFPKIKELFDFYLKNYKKLNWYKKILSELALKNMKITVITSSSQKIEADVEKNIKDKMKQLLTDYKKEKGNIKNAEK